MIYIGRIEFKRLSFVEETGKSRAVSLTLVDQVEIHTDSKATFPETIMRSSFQDCIQVV
jgi:hypothetical protein